jgi:sorbose reductase
MIGRGLVRYRFILQGKQVLFVSSISGLVAMSPQNQSAYNGSKAALTMMAKV